MTLRAVKILLNILFYSAVLDVIYSQESQNCLDVYNACKKEYICELNLNLTVKNCNFKWREDPPQYCPRSNSDLCKSAIKTNAIRFQFCVCSMTNENQNHCLAIWRALNKHPCIVQPPKFKPENSRDQYPSESDQSPVVVVPPKQITTNSEDLIPITNPMVDRNLRMILADLGMQAEEDNKPSCLERERLCAQSTQCRFLLDRFIKVCTFKNCEKNRDSCFTVYENFRSYGTFNCSCSREKEPERFQRCLHYQTRVIDNQCLALINSNTLYKSGPQVKISENSDSLLLTEDDIPKFKESINCVDQYRECIKDSQCLAKYLQLQRACRWNPRTNTCPTYNYCMAALQSMYQEPTPLTYNALTCECPALGDQECQRHKAIFRPSCAYRNRTSINCLLLMRQCVNNLTCLDSYTVFNEYCVRQGRSESSQNPVCLYSSTVCLDSYRTLWGRSLTLACTCDYGETLKIMANNPEKADESVKVCQHFREVLSRPPCLKASKHDLSSSVDYTSKPCQIIKRHNLPTDIPIRVYPPELPEACYKVCYCNRSRSGGKDICQEPVCDKPNSPDFSERDASDSCYIYAAQNPECVCKQGEISCQPFSIRTDLQSTGFSLDVLYNSTSRRRLFNQKNQFYLHQLNQSLNHILHNNTKTNDCYLLLLSHTEGQAKFLLSIKTLPYSAKSYFFREKKRQCFRALNLVTIMINEKYPEIRHILSLSILSAARLLKAKTLSDKNFIKTDWVVVDFSQEWPPPRPRMDMYNDKIDAGGSNMATSLRILPRSFILCISIGAIFRENFFNS